ncbi:hypothetical protein B0H19DRAFT_1242942 [Mycena capillaripes]|nr:hypothetical protein B0H19DRAFT_1242942 [Mycena capillaripes]
MVPMTLLTSTTLARDASDSETIALPFTRADLSEELPEQSIPPRHLETIKYVTIETWKSLRIPQAKSKFIAQDLSMLPRMQLDIVLENREVPFVSCTLPKQDCGRPNTDPDYVLWRHVCTPCMDNKHVHGLDSKADAETRDADRNGYAIAALYEASNSRSGYSPVESQIAVISENLKVGDFFFAALVVVTVSVSVRIDVKTGLEAFSPIFELNILQSLKRSQPGWPAGSSFSDLGADMQKRLISEGFHIPGASNSCASGASATGSRSFSMLSWWHFVRLCAAHRIRISARLAAQKRVLRSASQKRLYPATTHKWHPRSWTPPRSSSRGAWKCRPSFPAADNEHPDSRLLDRGTSIFRVQQSGYFGTSTAPIGSEETRGHRYRCSEYSASHLRSGAATAAALAAILGLDPDTVTAAQMDAVNARFVCPTGVRRQALQWRDCVVHDIEKAGSRTAPHSLPSWVVLYPLATADVKAAGGTGRLFLPPYLFKFH